MEDLILIMVLEAICIHRLQGVGTVNSNIAGYNPNQYAGNVQPGSQGYM